MTFAEQLRTELAEIEAMLIAKNEAYGNSALEPVRIFSKADPIEQIKVRLDDKLSRLAKGQAAGEDVELDLLGYLVLLRIARKGTRAAAGCPEGSRRAPTEKPRERVPCRRAEDDAARRLDAANGVHGGRHALHHLTTDH